MKLKEVLKTIDCVYEDKFDNLEINKIVHNSSEVENKALFIAIKGHTVDGHNYIPDAINRGAIAILCEDLPEIINENISYIKVDKVDEVLPIVSDNFYQHPSGKLNVIGITGTNGKTTTSFLIKYILDYAGLNTGLIGTTGYSINGVMNKLNNTTPDALTIQGIYNKMVLAKNTECIMEVSSHALKLGRVKNTDFQLGVFTNLTPEHLDFHPNMEDYYQTKKQLFEQTAKFNIINIDDKYGRRLVDELLVKTKLYTYGIESEADFQAINIENKLEGLSYTLITPIGVFKVKMNIAGRVNIYNSLAAIAAAFSLGIDIETILKGLENAENVPGRFEFVETNSDFHVLIDYAHTPDGYEKLFSTVDEFVRGRKIAIFGGGGDRDGSKRPVMGEIAAKNCDLIILTTDNPRTEDPTKIVNEILIGVKKSNGNYLFIEDRKEAIEYALKNHQSNDLIMLIGKGHERYQIIGHEKQYFNEREIVEKFMESIREEN